MSRRTMRRLAGGTAIGLGLGAGAFGLVVSGGGETATAGGGPAVEQRAAAMERFAIFRARRGAPVDPGVAQSTRRAGVDPSEARRAALPLGAPAVTVVPRQEALCVHVGVDGQPASAYGCARWEDALAGRTHLTLSGGPGQEDGEVLVVGVVPDGTEGVVLAEQGGAEALDVTDGVYVTEASGPESVTVTGQDGAAETIDLGGLPGANE